MSSTAELAKRNGEAKIDPSRYRNAVKATMKKRDPSSNELTAPSDAEVDRFLMEAAIYGLEPLAGQIYATWEDGVMKTVAHIDGLRLLAERTEKYDGQDDPEWCDEDGVWTDYWAGKDHPLAARVRVHKKGTKVPTTGTANWHDFAPKSEVGAGALWSMSGGKPAHMLSIRAEALALRKAFPSELSGLYTAEELDISLAALDTSPATADSPSISPPAVSPMGDGAARSGEEPLVIVDPPGARPSVAPVRQESRRTLIEVLESGEYDKLRKELTEALFDQLPDRLTDEQTEQMASALREADEAGVTAVELERLCKVALREPNIEARAEALLDWIAERRKKADVEGSPPTERADDSVPAEPDEDTDAGGEEEAR
jgi:hypothetical protein